MRKIILILTCFFILGVKGYAATITAVASGNWTTNGTWSCSCQPTNADNIVIPSGITVTSSGVRSLTGGPVITITISGTLALVNGTLNVDNSDIINITSGGKITGSGIGGFVFSGGTPFFVPNGSSVDGPTTISGGVLPITLLFFKGEARDSDVLLQWASATEENFDFYIINRSADGIQFEVVSKVKGAGQSSSRLDYSYTDTYPLQGVAYYRLQAIDLDGSYTDFPVIKVKFERSQRAMEIFPNPVTGNELKAKLNFYPEAGGGIAVYDSRGMIVLQKPLTATEHEYAFELTPSFIRGLYFVILKTKTESITTKVVVN